MLFRRHVDDYVVKIKTLSKEHGVDAGFGKSETAGPVEMFAFR
jgi:hypothetical protein